MFLTNLNQKSQFTNQQLGVFHSYIILSFFFFKCRFTIKLLLILKVKLHSLNIELFQSFVLLRNGKCKTFKNFLHLLSNIETYSLWTIETILSFKCCSYGHSEQLVRTALMIFYFDNNFDLIML
jgi:hypothetical protein